MRLNTPNAGSTNRACDRSIRHFNGCNRMSESSHSKTLSSTRLQFRTIDEIKAANSSAGLHFFAPGLIRIRRMRISPQVYAGRFLITSERPRIVLDATRRHTIREIMPDGSISAPADGCQTSIGLTRRSAFG